MNRLLILSLMMLGWFAMSSGQAATESGQSPVKQQQNHHRRGPKTVMLMNADGATASMWHPDLTSTELAIEHGQLTIPQTGISGYHALVIEQVLGDYKDVITRYEYQHGKPSKQTPARLAAAQKSDLEIVPDPIPREHHHYESAEEWGFIVKMFGQPLAGQPVTLTTTNGSVIKGATDHDGRVTLQIPDDFPELIAGERDNRTAQFSLTTKYQLAGMTYTSGLDADYRVNPMHWQSTPWGLAVIGLGLAVGGLAGRVKQPSKGEKA